MLLKRSLPFTVTTRKYNYMSAAQKLAKKVRINALKMANSGGGSHIGSALSIADILAVLYTDILHLDPKNPKQLMRRLRRLFNRAQMDENEINIMRGILASYKKQT